MDTDEGGLSDLNNENESERGNDFFLDDYIYMSMVHTEISTSVKTLDYLCFL